jgi:type IV pilus assembly protein PilF
MMRSKTRVNPLLLLSFMAFLSCVACAATEKKNNLLQDADWHFQMAAGYFDSHEIPLAIKELNTALTIEPNHENAHHLLGFIYFGRRNYGKALVHLKQAVAIKPTFHSARNNLGTLYLATERWEEAIGEFSQLVDEPLYPTPELAHNNIGWAQYNQNQLARALESFRMAVFLKPAFCLAHNNSGLAYLRLRNELQARKSFERAIKKCPTNYAEPHFHFGKLLEQEGDSTSQQHFQRCIEISPESNWALRCQQYLGI